jgi:hypothetical protein
MLSRFQGGLVVRTMSCLRRNSIVRVTTDGSADGLTVARTEVRKPDVTNADEISALENRRMAAVVDKDLAVLDELLASELSYSHSSGVLDTKTSYLAGISNSTALPPVEQSDVRITVLENTAVITGLAKTRLTSADSIGARFTAVWIRHETWQLLCWHSTKVASN